VRAQIAWKMSFTSGHALAAAAGHHRRAETRAFFAARNAGADIQQAFAFEIFGAADGVGEMGIAAIDDHVAGFQVGQQQFDEFIHRRARLHHQHDLAGPLQQAGHLLDGVGADDIGTWPLAASFRKSSTLETVRLKATTLYPWSLILRMRFWPMTASPIKAMSAVGSMIFQLAGTGDLRYSTRLQMLRFQARTHIGHLRHAQPLP
jgi:hypothetical protein